MPRYFFHVKRDVVTVLDQEGVAFANIAQASAETARRRRNIAMWLMANATAEQRA